MKLPINRGDEIMSSVFNQTTGECISGTCIETIKQYKMYFIFLMIFALSCMVVGIIISCWMSHKFTSQFK